MNRGSKKLKSQQGGSILLMLLLVLICVLVSASVIMAAMSNAGKIRSHRNEEQNYLAVSSALQTICDDLVNMKYTGNYHCQLTTITEGTGEETTTATSKAFGQLDGTIEGSALGESLCDDFDLLYGKRMKSDIQGFYDGGDKTIDTDATTVKEGMITSHVFTVTPQIDGLADRPVTITVNVIDSYSIELVANLDAFQMKAELTADETKPGTMDHQETGDYSSDHTMSWKLGWIAK